MVAMSPATPVFEPLDIFARVVDDNGNIDVIDVVVDHEYWDQVGDDPLT